MHRRNWQILVPTWKARRFIALGWDGCRYFSRHPYWRYV